MIDSDQLRLDADLIEVLRAGAGAAVAGGSPFVAPPHLLLGLLDDPLIGPAIAPLIPREHVLEAAARVPRSAAEAAGGAPEAQPEGDPEPFVRCDTLAFRTRDGTRTLYLDAQAFHVFVEGARRATGTYRAKHLVFAFTAEAVKERALLDLFGGDPQRVTKAVDALG